MNTLKNILKNLANLINRQKANTISIKNLILIEEWIYIFFKKFYVERDKLRNEWIDLSMDG